mmetsp:Transcript_21361/g.59294  ORF Transcript_21361/g.59294 Transcript_21361/m.59294 type:complete len:277 (+) Transcript_21361:139-969(+)
MLDSTNTLKRFLMVSMLSSARPSLRPRSLFSMTSSGQSKKMMKSQSRPQTFSNASRFSALRGNPSIRNLVLPLDFMASCRSPTVTSEGTICPCCIISATLLPSGVPDLTWARRRSPALKWATSGNSLTILAHCVPLPEPGPPSTKTIVVLVSTLAEAVEALEGDFVVGASRTAEVQEAEELPVVAAPTAAKPRPRVVPSRIRENCSAVRLPSAAVGAKVATVEHDRAPADVRRTADARRSSLRMWENMVADMLAGEIGNTRSRCCVSCGVVSSRDL